MTNHGFIGEASSAIMGYLVRERYLNLLRAGRGAVHVVKVITGMRRSGKTVLMQMYVDELKATGVPESDIVYMNLESLEYQGMDKDALNSILRSRMAPGRLTYILLDEIQAVEGWEMTLAGLDAAGCCDVYVTGSNSDMLSSALATHISGRHVEIEVLPFSFEEFVRFHDIKDRREAFSEYLMYGGLPGVDPPRGSRFAADYLQGVYSTVLVKDVLRVSKVGDPAKIDAIIKFIFSNIGNVTNISRISKDVGIPESTVSLYMRALEEALLVMPCDRYDAVGRRLLKTNRKYYVSDIGLRSAVLGMAAGTDISRPLENIVYLELRRRGYRLMVQSYRDAEIDFVASRNDSIEYFQVCQTLASEGTRASEVKALLHPEDNYPKTVLTLDEYGLGIQDGVRIANLLDWLLEDGGRCGFRDLRALPLRVLYSSTESATMPSEVIT